MSVGPVAELHAAYERQLRTSLEPPFEKGLDPSGTRSMLNASLILPAGELHEADHGRIWVWSDLHLGDAMSLLYFGRPHDTVGEMDDALLKTWCRVVGEDDTVVVLGDVALPALDEERLEQVLAAPGRKILVFGNHDHNGRGGIVTDGFDEAYLALYAPGDPPLLLTHIPLREVPEGAVNVHGDLHQHRVPGRTRHVNVSVEQVGYQPQPLTAIRRLGGRLVRGEVVPGGTTAEQLLELLP